MKQAVIRFEIPVDITIHMQMTETGRDVLEERINLLEIQLARSAQVNLRFRLSLGFSPQTRL
jgi:hypothetical protein